MRKLSSNSLILSCLLIVCFNSLATELPWLKAVGTTSAISNIESIEASANVTVSDGLTYKTVSSWQDNERVIFHREYPEQMATLGRSGEYYWSFDGKVQRDSDNSIKDFVLGHQFHAFLLFFQEFDMSNSATISDSDLCLCQKYSDTDNNGNTHSVHYLRDNQQPQYIVTQYREHGEVKLKLGDWKRVETLSLPYQIEIYHGDRVFNYQFDDIQFNTREQMNALKPSYDKLNDKQQLIRLHRDMMDAHIESDGALMAHVWAPEVLIVNRGELINSTGEKASKMMTDSLKSRRHSKYIDLVKPQIQVSPDGKMGYATIQVYAQGYRLKESGEHGESFNFTSAWIAVFEKQQGQWRLTANASNFK